MEKAIAQDDLEVMEEGFSGMHKDLQSEMYWSILSRFITEANILTAKFCGHPVANANFIASIK